MNILKKDRKSSLNVYFWAITYLKKYLWLVICIVICGVFVTIGEMVVPIFFQQFVDKILPENNMEIFLCMIVGILFLLIIMFFLKALQNILQVKIQEYATRDLMFDFYKKLRVLGYSHYERHPVGETLSLFQVEATLVKRIYSQFVPEILRSTLILCSSIVLMMLVHWQLALLSFPAYLLYYLVGPYFSKKAAAYSRDVNKKRRDFYKKVYDSMAALLELRVFQTEKWDLSRFIKLQKEMYRMNLLQLTFNYMRGAVRELTINLGTLLTFGFGVYFIKNNEMSIGSFIAFSFYYFIVMNQLGLLIKLLIDQSITIVQAKRLYNFFQLIPEIKESESTITLKNIRGEIRFEDVSFGYTDNFNVLTNFYLTIKPGERIALVGSSGGGKSTILKLLCRFYDPNNGVIKLDGIPLDQLSLSQIRRKVGYVFQEPYLFDSTIRENIQFGCPDATEKEIIDAAVAANAHKFIKDLHDGYDTKVGERGVKLSGGQKQRIVIAQMFLKNPSIVVLDEATSALDSITESEVQKALDRLFSGRTTIVVAHRITTVKHYDRLVLIKKGCIVESGSFKELIKRKGDFYRLVVGGEKMKHG